MNAQQQPDENLPAETWLPVVDQDRYEVSSHGRVRSLGFTDRLGRNHPPKVLSQHLHKTRGYPTVHIRIGSGRTKTVDVHQLACTAFHGPRPDGQEVRHLNDIKTDNRADNLEWGSKTQNSHDAVRNGTHPMARKTHCKRGHEFTPENTRLYKGRRWCRQCQSAYKADWQREKRRAAREKGRAA